MERPRGPALPREKGSGHSLVERLIPRNRSQHRQNGAQNVSAISQGWRKGPLKDGSRPQSRRGGHLACGELAGKTGWAGAGLLRGLLAHQSKVISQTKPVSTCKSVQGQCSGDHKPWFPTAQSGDNDLIMTSFGLQDGDQSLALATLPNCTLTRTCTRGWPQRSRLPRPPWLPYLDGARAWAEGR